MATSSFFQNVVVKDKAKSDEIKFALENSLHSNPNIPPAEIDFKKQEEDTERFVKNFLKQKEEDEYDLACYVEAKEEFEKNPTVYTTKEIAEELNIKL